MNDPIKIPSTADLPYSIVAATATPADGQIGETSEKGGETSQASNAYTAAVGNAKDKALRPKNEVFNSDDE